MDQNLDTNAAELCGPFTVSHCEIHKMGATYAFPIHNDSDGCTVAWVPHNNHAIGQARAKLIAHVLNQLTGHAEPEPSGD